MKISIGSIFLGLLMPLGLNKDGMPIICDQEAKAIIMIVDEDGNTINIPLKDPLTNDEYEDCPKKSWNQKEE